MKKIARGFWTVLFFAVIVTVSVAAANPAKACTAVYVGEEASDDGTIIIARSNDYPDNWPNYVTVVDHVDNKPGRTMPVDNGDTVFEEIPATTYKYTATPWMDSATSNNGLQSDAAACANECGVVMTMSISAFTNDAALAADPEPETGITEFTADDLVICQSATAREAVEVLTGLIDKYGSSESNIAIISDQNETWYVEMYTGHEYAAVKLPQDMVAVFGNEFTLEYLSDYESSIVSDNLESLAVDNGFAVYGDNGELNLMETYAVTLNYSHMRTWIGHQLLAPSVYSDDYDEAAVYPLTFTADEKVSLQDVMSVIRNRYEGTEYSPDETGRPDMRVIGTDTALSVHILQVYPDLPSEMSCVTWESTGPAIYGVFVPVSNLCTTVSESYGLNQPASDLGEFDSDTYPWYAFKELTTLCLNDYEVYGTPVREYWNEAESNMIAGMRQVLETAAESASAKAAAEYVTNYCNTMQEQAFSDAKELLNDVIWYQCKYCNTMKCGRNPETHEATDELTKHDPIPVDLDSSAYADIPELEQTSTAPVWVIIVIAVVVIAVVATTAVCIKKKSDKTEK